MGALLPQLFSRGGDGPHRSHGVGAYVSCYHVTSFPADHDADLWKILMALSGASILSAIMEALREWGPKALATSPAY